MADLPDWSRKAANASPGSGWTENVLSGAEFQIPLELYCFYSGSELGTDGFPRNGSLWEDGSYEGEGVCSLFDVTGKTDSRALLVLPESGAGLWKIVRKQDRVTFLPSAGQWRIKVYAGNEPDWQYHPFPFRDLPGTDSRTHHAFVRGLLDFLAGTRRSPANGIVFQSPQTSIGKGYSGDGIPDTFFQFCSAYRHLSEPRKAYFRSQLDWLGNHLRFDGCVPWGGCRQDVPYYHIWKRPDCGMFSTATDYGWKCSVCSIALTRSCPIRRK